MYDVVKEMDGYIITGMIEEYSINYKVYAVVKTVEDNPVYLDHTDYESVDINDMSNLTPYMTGFVKWDGSVHLYFNEQDNCMLYFGCTEDFQRLHDVFNMCLELTKKNLDKWDS